MGHSTNNSAVFSAVPVPMNSQQTAKQFGRPSLPHVRIRQSYFEWNWRRSMTISSNLNKSIIFCSLSFMSRTISLACRGS